MKRFRVRAGSKTYKDPGPDLLRPSANAAQQFGKNMGSAGTHWYTRRDPAGDEKWTNWSGPMPRREVLQRVNNFLSAPAGAKFQAGRPASGGRVDMRTEMVVVNVAEVPLAGVKQGAKLIADLTREQFSCDVGGFSCREYNNVPGSGWSDHAWGDAVDLDINGGSPGPNDRLTDWCVRMARAGCFGPVSQFIGSKGGRVYSYIAPSYAANAGGPASHLTHVHCSYKQHFGADPNCR